jgi:uncharacterized membrane protein
MKKDLEDWIEDRLWINTMVVSTAAVLVTSSSIRGNTALTSVLIVGSFFALNFYHTVTLEKINSEGQVIKKNRFNWDRLRSDFKYYLLGLFTIGGGVVNALYVKTGRIPQNNETLNYFLLGVMLGILGWIAVTAAYVTIKFLAEGLAARYTVSEVEE